MILAGDIGGTKTVLALFEARAGRPHARHERVFASAEHAGLEELLAAFLAGAAGARPRAACLAVAGPVLDGSAALTNLPWPGLSEEGLGRALGAPVVLINDLAATALGTLELGPRQLAPLNPDAGPERSGNRAVVSAGTGLGEAFLVWDGTRHLAVSGEGGHADLAPRNALEVELLDFLRGEQRGRVSLERALSGPGLAAIHRFARRRAGDSGADPTRDAGDPAAAVAAAGLSGRDPAAAEALELFAALLGAEAGNAALRVLAVGGVYLAGGIAPRILPALRSGALLEAFTDKGRFAPLLAGLPLHVVLEPRAPLLGAARRALEP